MTCQKRVIRPWTDDEEQHVVETVSDIVLKENKLLEDALQQVSADLNRTIEGCRFRWSRHIRPILLEILPADDPLIMKLKFNNPATRYQSV